MWVFASTGEYNFYWHWPAYPRCYKVNDSKTFKNLVVSLYALCSQILCILQSSSFNWSFKNNVDLALYIIGFDLKDIKLHVIDPFHLQKAYKLFKLTLYLPGKTGVLELQYSSFNSAATFQKYFTYLIISTRLVKFNMEIKFNIFSVFDLLEIASIIQDFHFPMVMLHPLMINECRLHNFWFWCFPISKNLTFLWISILYIKTLSLYFYIILNFLGYWCPAGG